MVAEGCRIKQSPRFRRELLKRVSGNSFLAPLISCPAGATAHTDYANYFIYIKTN
jgi:hypothetical protein